MKKEFDGTYYLCLLSDLPPWARAMVEKTGKRRIMEVKKVKQVELTNNIRAQLTHDGQVYLWSLSGHKITPDSLERVKGGGNVI